MPAAAERRCEARAAAQEVRVDVDVQELDDGEHRDVAGDAAVHAQAELVALSFVGVYRSETGTLPPGTRSACRRASNVAPSDVTIRAVPLTLNE